jgi:hypothetical protein
VRVNSGDGDGDDAGLGDDIWTDPGPLHKDDLLLVYQSSYSIEISLPV